MSRLILVKHSLPHIDPNAPAREWHLSDEGWQRCEALANRLAAHRPDAIVSSDEPKAIETAQIVAVRLGLTNEIVGNLHEHDRSNAGFLGSDEFEAVVRHFFDHPDELVLGKETANAAHARFSRAVLNVVEANPNRNIVLVAHGTVITLFVSHALQRSPHECRERSPQRSDPQRSRHGAESVPYIEPHSTTGAVGLRPFEFWKRLELPSFVALSLPELKLEEVVWSVRDE